ETTIYLQQDRSRTELRFQDGRPLQGVGPTVVRCDLRQALDYPPNSVSYTARPYPPPRVTEEMARTLGLRTTPNYRTAEPTLRIETTYKDTGERREAFGLTARHIIITERQIPNEDRRTLPRTEIIDGWFINLEIRTSCERQYAIDARNDPVFYRNETIENIETTKAGDVPDPTQSWIAVESKHVAWQSYPNYDGTMKEVFQGGNKERLTKIEEVPMDPALFGPLAFYGRVPSNGLR
ncbi:MAG TPA: hypothetical protein VE783_06260, partial [Candidatus Limnocylindrales bacterium]|nr:hypothetical protein [Candidatus Limnocylindrales bacterium]